MTQSTTPRREVAWAQVDAAAHALGGTTLNELFAAEPGRVGTMGVEACGLYADFSKQRVDAASLDALFALADAADLPSWIARLFAGEPINHTEGRAVLHPALRAPREADFAAVGEPVMGDVHEVLDRMAAFTTRVRDGDWLGHTGQRITDVVNIGIGGSDLGPRMVCEALVAGEQPLQVHFVSNVDATEITRVCAGLDAATTLFIVTSKSFGTAETLANAATAKAWLLGKLGDDADVAKHFVAVSTNHAAVADFGIDTDNMFGFWDWVGGRYSLWSAVGLSIALAVGMDSFRDLLAGAHAMDTHFQTAPLRENLPVWLGLIGIWNTNALGLPSQVIVPYAQALARLPAYLQQLEMESTGKGVTRGGAPVPRQTIVSLWGDIGTNGQHAFFQMLHQGPQALPVDFILPKKLGHDVDHQHRMLVANCLAQSEALMCGKTAEQVRQELTAKGLAGDALEAAIPHRVFTGNRPSTTIVLPTVDANTLGSLIALYEHKVFVQSVLWDINAFDQWGVELGKQLATVIDAELSGGEAQAHDASTTALIAKMAG